MNVEARWPRLQHLLRFVLGEVGVVAPAVHEVVPLGTPLQRRVAKVSAGLKPKHMAKVELARTLHEV